ncbi:MAG: hypothetical protein AAF843_20170 [Bacteroidota bacterium]
MKDQQNIKAVDVAREAVARQAYQFIKTQVAEDPDRFGRMKDAIMYAYCIAETNPRFPSGLPVAYKEAFLDYLNLVNQIDEVQSQIQKLEYDAR